WIANREVKQRLIGGPLNWSLENSLGIELAYSGSKAASRRFASMIMTTQFDTGRLASSHQDSAPVKHRSFAGRLYDIASGRLLLFPKQPCLQAIEIDIDDWRRIEREKLRQCEAADDGVTERLT